MAEPVFLVVGPPAAAGMQQWTETKGLLTLASGQGGSKQAHIRWDVPDVSAMPDLKCSILDFGTAAGVYDILSGKDLSTVLQQGANEVLVKQLTDATHFWRVRFCDSEGNLTAYCAEQSTAVEDAWTAPLSPTSVGQADFPLTMSAGTNYRLSENVTIDSGTACTPADNCTIDFNGKTLSVANTGQGTGFLYPSGLANFRIFDSQSTAGKILVGTQSGSIGIRVDATLGGSNVISDIDHEHDSPTGWNISFDDAALGNDIRVFNSGFTIHGGVGGISLDTGGINDPNDCHIYGCGFTLASDNKRTYCIHHSGGQDGYTYVWDCAATISFEVDSSANNHGFFAKRTAAATATLTYHHDIDITDVNGDNHRVWFCDGPGGNHRTLWSTMDMSNAVAAQGACTGFDVRQELTAQTHNKYVAVGFCTFNLGGNAAPNAVRFTGEPFTGSPPNVTWRQGFDYHNVVNNCADPNSALVIGRDHDECFHWGNTWNKGSGYTGMLAGWSNETGDGADANDEHFNDIVITGGGTLHIKGPSSTQNNINWNVFNSWTSGQCNDNSQVTYAGAWTGYDPNVGDLPTPTGMGTVVGVH